MRHRTEEGDITGTNLCREKCFTERTPQCPEDIWRPAGERSVHPLPLRGDLVGIRSAGSSALTHGHTPFSAHTYPSRTCGSPQVPSRPLRAAIARSGMIQMRLQTATPAAAVPPPPGGSGPEPRSSRETRPRAGGLGGAGGPGRRALPRPNPHPGTAPRGADAAAPPSFGSARCRRRPLRQRAEPEERAAPRIPPPRERGSEGRGQAVPRPSSSTRGAGVRWSGRGAQRAPLPPFFLRRRGRSSPRRAVRRREAEPDGGGGRRAGVGGGGHAGGGNITWRCGGAGRCVVCGALQPRALVGGLKQRSRRRGGCSELPEPLPHALLGSAGSSHGGKAAAASSTGAGPRRAEGAGGCGCRAAL